MAGRSKNLLKVLLGLGLSWFLATSVGSGANALPREVATKFLADLRAGSFDLERDTSISPFCSDKRKAAIAERLESLGERFGQVREVDRSFFAVDEQRLSDLLGDETRKFGDGSRAFHWAGERIEGRFGVVLLMYNLRMRPDQVELLPICLQLGEGSAQEIEDGSEQADGAERLIWRVAPLLTSFENAELGFDAATRSAVDQLETWAGAEIKRLSGALRQLRMDTFSQRLKELDRQLSAELDGGFELVLSFRRALQQGNADLAMVHLEYDRRWLEGGELGEAFRQLYSYLLAAIDGERRVDEPLWQCFADPINIVIEGGSDGGDFESEMNCFVWQLGLDGAKTSLNFGLRRSEIGWRLNLPVDLRQGSRRLGKSARLRQEDELEDKYGLAFFERAVQKEHRGQAFAGVEEFLVYAEERILAGDLVSLIAQMESIEEQVVGEGRDLLSFVDDPLGLDSGPLEDVKWEKVASLDELLIGVSELSKSWARLSVGCGRDGKRLLRVSVQETEELAMVYWAIVSPLSLATIDVFPLLLVKGADGWRISIRQLAAEYLNQDAEGERVVVKSHAEIRQEVRIRLLEELYAEVDYFGEEKLSTAASDTLERAWNQLLLKLQSGKFAGVRSRCLLFDRAELSESVMNGMGYLLQGLAKEGGEMELLEVKSEGTIGGVFCKWGDPHLGNRVRLYVFAHVAEGWKLLPEIQFETATNLARKLLNEQAEGVVVEFLGDAEQEKVNRLRAYAKQLELGDDRRGKE